MKAIILANFVTTLTAKKVEELQERAKVSFPEPIFCESKCLVEDFMGDSIPISEYLLDESAIGMSIRRELAGPLLQAFLKIVFMDNFVHCDLHPGNILVRKTESSPSTLNSWWDNVVWSDDGRNNADVESYTIAFLDAGIVTTLNDNDQQNLKDLFTSQPVQWRPFFTCFLLVEIFNFLSWRILLLTILVAMLV